MQSRLSWLLNLILLCFEVNWILTTSAYEIIDGSFAIHICQVVCHKSCFLMWIIRKWFTGTRAKVLFVIDQFLIFMSNRQWNRNGFCGSAIDETFLSQNCVIICLLSELMRNSEVFWGDNDHWWLVSEIEFIPVRSLMTKSTFFKREIFTPIIRKRTNSRWNSKFCESLLKFSGC